MQVRVLGSGAGGGFPQWNCACASCEGLRRGRLSAQPRSQSSIALSDDGERWLLVNASPDVREQINRTPALWPRRAPRHTPIGAVLLVDAQIDHVTGLLSLREGPRLHLYCTEPVAADLRQGFPLLKMLEHYCGVTHHPVTADGNPFAVAAVPGLTLRALAVPGKAPPYSPHRHDPHPGDNVALVAEDRRGARLFYAPGLGGITSALIQEMTAADCLLVDGTFWTNDEMAQRGCGNNDAASMGHLPQSGPGGMIERLSGLHKPRKILIHINNTNPILDDDGAERRQLAEAGIELAYDGMEIAL
ncbi:MAG: pyrroloquinoline quinone biosynthesis protein PqqB [Gammaproteobacteria bacterium]|nr:pyrroloquinoline quinone biosynthesis protein PqqB [Gammaproteobacteria bacterium]